MKNWHGETSIAEWNASGGNKPRDDMLRDYAAMFDDDLSTFWHGCQPVSHGEHKHRSQTHNVVVTFRTPIKFYELIIVTRPSDGFDDERMDELQTAYQSMCVVLDDNPNPICTSADNKVTLGQQLVLSFGTSSVTKVQLNFQNGVSAMIADLSIWYKGTVKCEIKLDIVLIITINNQLPITKSSNKI